MIPRHSVFKIILDFGGTVAHKGFEVLSIVINQSLVLPYLKRVYFYDDPPWKIEFWSRFSFKNELGWKFATTSITSNFYCEPFFSLHIVFVELVLDNLCVIVVSGGKSNVSGVW